MPLGSGQEYAKVVARIDQLETASVLPHSPGQIDKSAERYGVDVDCVGEVENESMRSAL